MSAMPQGPEVKLLAWTGGAGDRCRRGFPSRRRRRPRPRPSLTPSTTPLRQLSELPRDELDHLAEEFGLEPRRYRTRQHLVAAIHDRRQMIATLDRDAMLDVIRWGRRPVTANASREQVAQEIVRIRSMRFAGLSQRGLVGAGAASRARRARDDDPVPVLSASSRGRRGSSPGSTASAGRFLGTLIARMIGDAENAADYQFLPDDNRRPAGAAHGAGPVALYDQGGDRGVGALRRDRQPRQENRRLVPQPEAR